MSSGARDAQGPPEVMMVETEDTQVAEFRLYEGNVEIIVGMCTDYLTSTIDRVWRDFYAFSTALALLGGLLSFLLYRQQSSHLAQAHDYERRISAERENASLGRAAASIAHEIRNPLNALKMGLQRLQLEGNEITPEHQRLVDLMLDAVRRTNGIVSSLLNFARPQTPERTPMRLDLLVKDVLDLYLPRCKELGIRVAQDMGCNTTISGDPDLLHQAVENLLKNAIEAQPDGGFLNLGLGRKGHELFFQVENGGFTHPPSEAERILDPYFTTKTTGTGLGLSITRRIIRAHDGRIHIQSKNPGTINITFYLPISHNKPETPSKEKEK